MVTNEQIIKTLRENAEARIGIVERKNSNYAGGGPEGNAFKNFDMIEIITNGNISREAGMLVRITDKVARLGVLMTGGQDAVGEAVEDTLADLANYADLAIVAWKDKERTKKSEAFARMCEELDNDMQKKHALDGAEQMSLEFDDDMGNNPPAPVVTSGQMQVVNTTPESPSSRLSRFLNFGRAGKSAA